MMRNTAIKLMNKFTLFFTLSFTHCLFVCDESLFCSFELYWLTLHSLRLSRLLNFILNSALQNQGHKREDILFCSLSLPLLNGTRDYDCRSLLSLVLFICENCWALSSLHSVPIGTTLTHPNTSHWVFFSNNFLYFLFFSPFLSE